jgi:hypothetical protein
MMTKGGGVTGIQQTKTDFVTGLEVGWQEVHSPGAYVDTTTGELYRFPNDAIGPSSPKVARESLREITLVHLSDNPFIATNTARLLCAQQNINPNF